MLPEPAAPRLVFGPGTICLLFRTLALPYSNQYEQMEWGIFPHQGNMMDVLWERSALKHVAKVKTPTMLMQGENDSDVPIAGAEQYYIALRDVGVDAVMVRYPREGHGIREPRHIVDSIDRSVRWYVKLLSSRGKISERGPSRAARGEFSVARRKLSR